MDQPSQHSFLDVPALLESSLPRLRPSVMPYALGVFMLMVLVSAFFTAQSGQARSAVDLLSAVAMMALIAFMGFMTWWVAKRAAMEEQELAAIEEMIQLRRWGDAGVALEHYLSRPARRPAARTQALVYLAAVLGRFHRFSDAVGVYDHLLEHDLLDAQSAHGLRLGRAMSLLRDDRLYDADRALAELRRSPDAANSAGLALVEIYRDVKTGHPQEAVEVFVQKREVMRKQLGTRVADAHVLAARAYDLLGRSEEAQSEYERATLLADPSELVRRYPEVEALAGIYRAAHRPADLAPALP